MAACALFVVLAGSPAGVAQQAAARATGASASAPVGAARVPKPNVKAEEEETAKPGKPGSEGIKIHGHWVLQVKNVDGTLGERREFDNSLVPSFNVLGGDLLLLALLSGNAVPGDPGVLLVQETQANAGADCEYTANKCFLITTTNSPLIKKTDDPMTNYYPAIIGSQTGLTLNANLNFGSAVSALSWTLSGNFVVPAALNTVNVVQTAMPMCVPYGSRAYADLVGGGNFAITGSSADIAPMACSGLVPQAQPDNVFYPMLTSTTIMTHGVATPLTNLVAGQVITVTVTLSLS
jgi:hypothetical protein